jgi:hypothetical protein
VRAFALLPIVVFFVAGTFFVPGRRAHAQSVVLNEIHYHPADGSREGEFVELQNHGAGPVDISGWVLVGGVDFTFPPGAIAPAGGYVLVAADSLALAGSYGLDPELVAGSYEGSLANEGELLRLYTAEGYLASSVEYRDSAPWPELSDGLGASLERLSPLREGEDPGAWAASILAGGTPGVRNSVARDDRFTVPTGERVELVPAGAEWRFFRGRSAPPADWRSAGFDATSWEVGRAGFGFGDADDATVLADMEGGYTTVYVRTTFQVADPGTVGHLALRILYDDGFVAYVNGVEITRENVVITTHDASAAGSHEADGFEEFIVARADSILVGGANVIALQGHNGALANPDFSLSPALDAILLDPDPPPEPPPPAPPERDLVVNELAAGGEGTGWIELYNPTGSPVDASGRRLTPFASGRGGRVLPPGSIVAPGGYLVFGESTLGFEIDPLQACLLVTSDGRLIDAFDARSSRDGLSSGRVPDGGGERAVFSAPTPGLPNRFQPQGSIVVNEIMYHPPGGGAGGEYVELFNRGGTAVDLGGWRFSRGIAYTFPAGTAAPAGGFVVVAADPAAVEERHGIRGVLGPWEGRLSNDAETLVLRDALENIADRVRYADEGSWPEAADGRGPSLELVHAGLENRWGPAWAASPGEGTPGAANSALRDDPPPVVGDVSHFPVVPAPADGVRVLATVSDERAVGEVTLLWEVDGSAGAPAARAMADDGVADDGIAGNRVYGADIPPQARLAVVAFWIRARTAGGQETTVPAGAPRPSFLYQVEDPSREEVRPRYRVVMRAADLVLLETRGVELNSLIDVTFVADGRAFYNRGIRYRGATVRDCGPRSYRIQFDHDVDFHGTKRLNLNGCNVSRQWLGLDSLRRMGIPAPLAWFRRLSLNGRLELDWHLRVEAIDDAFIERAFPGDDQGNLYRCINHADLQYRGDDSIGYRTRYHKVTNKRVAGWQDITELCFFFDDETTASADFLAGAERKIDAEEWANYFASFALLGSTEGGILTDRGEDYFLYHRPSDGRWVILPWDLDSVFRDAEQRLFRPTLDSIERFLESTSYAPLYWCYLEANLESAFTPEVVAAQSAHLAPLFAAPRVAALEDFAGRRREFVAAQRSRSLDVESGGGAVVCGSALYAPGAFALEGRAPTCGTSEVLVNGAQAAYDPLAGTWTASVAAPGSSRLDVVARDRDGLEVARSGLDVVLEEGPAGRLHEQALGAHFLAFKAADYDAVSDPDGDGNVWTEAAGAAGALGPSSVVLRAPEASASPDSTAQSHASYRLRFRQPGTYRGYFRGRGFDFRSDAFHRPDDFGAGRDPDNRVQTSRDGVFAWTSEGDYIVTQEDVDAGAVLEFRLGVRELRLELDAVVLSTSIGLAPEALDDLVDFRPEAPRAVVIVRPSSMLRLEGGTARATLDGAFSHDGRCDGSPLELLWERLGGPAGDVLEGDPTASVVGVRFSSGGTWSYRLRARTVAGVEDTEDVSITVLEESGPQFLRGDCNGDGRVTGQVTDAIFLLNFSFLGGARPPCLAACDADGDGRTGGQVTDAIFILNLNFLGGVLPPPPYPGCGAPALASDLVLGCGSTPPGCR